jgi:lipid-binding SYLF domain-containing protein
VTVVGFGFAVQNVQDAQQVINHRLIAQIAHAGSLNQPTNHCGRRVASSADLKTGPSLGCAFSALHHLAGTRRMAHNRRAHSVVKNDIGANTKTCASRTRPMKAKSLMLFISMGTIATLVALTGTAALALETAALDKQVAATLDRFYALSKDHQSLAQNAAAVLVFPSITKAGIGVGGEHGDGALLENGKTVGYYSISGASIGLTLGAARHSEVILFNTPEARDKFVKGSDWSIGADTSVAVMKTGAGGVYDTQTLKKPVLAFVFGEKGLMGDASLKGAKISKIKQ